ncbi:MAG: HAMP domain-containing protein [Chloroflexi bacterium]|nr:HAMP domain-containing protein [Chloroflexota bacterium]
MPIRWRLTLWFSLLLCAVLFFSGAVLYIVLNRYLNDEIDQSLRVYSAQVHGTFHPDYFSGEVDYAVIHNKLPPANEFALPGVYVQLIERSGKVAVKSDNLGEQQLPVAPALIEKGFSGKIDIETVSAGDGARVRVMVSPLYLKDQTLLLEVARSLKLVDATMNRVTWALLADILVALTLAVILGASMVRRTLSPVRRITSIARGIEASSDLGRRVGYKGPADEIGELATTFDRMLEHLDSAFQSQKHFIADASHDLRSPLTVIKGNLDLLKRNLSESDRKESLRAIDAETGRMTKIVSDLLVLAEVESGRMEKQEMVSLRGVFLDGLARARQIGKSRKIIVGRQEDLRVRGDSHGLKQLLANLVDNAVKYTPEGGTITLSLFRDGNWARMEVADTGIGIAPEHLPHIFDRFYRVDKARSRASGGTGLGLSIVKGIAEQHGGKVTVTSQLGKGSTFTAWLKL